MFGLEVKASVLGSQEDNGKREGEEREVYGCVCTLTGGWHILTGGLLCVEMCVCACLSVHGVVQAGHVCRFECLSADVGKDACELLACKNQSPETERR